MPDLDETNRYTFLYLLGVLMLLLPGCMMLDERRSSASTESLLEIDPSLDGLDYRLRRSTPKRSQVEDAEETMRVLRYNLRELQSEFKRLVARGEDDPGLDSAAIDLRKRVDDLAIHYMAASLGQLESKDRFMDAVETRFGDLDRELAVLEVSIFQWELRDRFDQSIADLYRLRHGVSLRLSEAAASSDPEFFEMKTELALSIGRFDIMIAHAKVAVDHAYNAKYPIRSIHKLWL